ncbi:MAG: tetratricopeptide repeat protein [Acidobacteriota bacterium]|jgi:tetratricopeptide (TPR) repeat protein|nr:tetratricopeptide repeat protein [Acidobacteriota bacterium]
MKRWIWLAFAIVALATAGVTLIALPRTPEWTTSSTQAFSEIEAGQADLNKFYFREALRHFQLAHELDPDLLIAKWRITQLLMRENSDQASRFVDELMTADLSTLTPREKFFIEHWRAVRNDQPDEAARLLDECIREHPNDPYMLERKAMEAWQQVNFEDGDHLNDAERLYEELLELDPNWVIAYNMLGYIRMMQGRFAEAEESFKSYRFIAPDQANPHDSLGELYITTGRYDEAEDSLNRAIEIKRDFWASYIHLAILKSYSGDFEGAYRVIERGRAEEMPKGIAFGMECRTHFAELAQRGEWRQVLDERGSECVAGFKNSFAAIITHRAACRTGDWETATALEDEAEWILGEAEKSGDLDLSLAFQALTPHLRGVRLAIEGDFGAAEKQLRESDNRLSFMEVDFGMYKLYNRLLLAETLLAARQDADAHQLVAAVRRINPPMVKEFEASGFRILGLGSRLTPDSTRSTEEAKPQSSRVSL